MVLAGVSAAGCSAGCRCARSCSRSRSPACYDVPPWLIGNEFYVNMASQVLIYASVRALHQHDAWIWRHGLARARRLSWHRRLCLHPCYACRLQPAGRGGLRDRALDCGGGVLRRAFAARARSRLHHDYACARPDRLGHRLPGERSDRRRQRDSASWPADALWHRHHAASAFDTSP